MKDKATRILLIDDEADLLLCLSAFFEDEGYDVLTAASGEDGISLLSQHCPEAGIVDMRLPGIDGNEVIIQANKLCPAMKFIIYTGSSDYSLPEHLRKIGLTDDNVFIKPVNDMNTLAVAISELLESN